MVDLTDDQVSCLREIAETGNAPLAGWQAINSVWYAHRLIERAYQNTKPHPTSPLAWWRLTDAGRAELEARS